MAKVKQPAPVAVGGVGGSGTRLVAMLLRQAGVQMGHDLNDASDTLWFTLLFKRLEILECSDAEFGMLVEMLVAGLAGGRRLTPQMEALACELARDARDQHSALWLRARCESLLAAAREPARPGPWGWKEPNTHMVIERLWRWLPDLRYVHVVRNGIDMAWSRNQNQLALWGTDPAAGNLPATPRRSLEWWCRVHRRMQRVLAANPQRMYWLDYNALCREPEAEVVKLFAFLGLDPAMVLPALDQVQEPPPRDNIDLDELDPADVEYARSLGYGVEQEEALGELP